MKLIPQGSDEYNRLQTMFFSLDPGKYGNNIKNVDPAAEFSQLSKNSNAYKAIQSIAATSWKISVALGQGYLENSNSINVNTMYYYEIWAADENGANMLESPLTTDIQVTPGIPILPNKPENVIAQTGDNQVLLLWNYQGTELQPRFIVSRVQSIYDPWSPINENNMSFLIEKDLMDKKTVFNPVPYPQIDENGNTVANIVYSVTPNGFIDAQTWDQQGNPITRTVDGYPVSGPENDVTYYYRIAALDLFNQEGGSSNIVSAVPIDKTPPKTPVDLNVVAQEPNGTLEISWNKVTQDINDHIVQDIAGYRIYRSTQPEDIDSFIQIGGLVLQPSLSVSTVTKVDSDPILRPEYGEQEFWYRVVCVDKKGNESSFSITKGAHLLDITPPTSPRILRSKGYDDYIEIEWFLNTDKDVVKYEIYRSCCHLGHPAQKVPLFSDDEILGNIGFKWELYKDLEYVGTLWQSDAILISEASGAIKGKTTTFQDWSVPTGSPLCYAYVVKTFDLTQNMSGDWPVPDFDKEDYICQSLFDSTPPKPAIISGLWARDGGILIEWIGEPVQDIGAYHVYRSESEFGSYRYAGGQTVEIPSPQEGKPPLVESVMLEPPIRFEGYKQCVEETPVETPIETPEETPTETPSETPSEIPIDFSTDKACGCNTIPLFIRDDMSHGCFFDRHVDSKQIYWYKVVGVDQAGWEGDLNEAAPVSTFTFTMRQPEKSIISITDTPFPCALVVTWTPSYDFNKHRGYAIYRSENGPQSNFHQLGSIIKGNTYEDKNVVRGIPYWYKVQQVDLDGNLSPSSDAVVGMVKP